MAKAPTQAGKAAPAAKTIAARIPVGRNLVRLSVADSGQAALGRVCGKADIRSATLSA